MLLYKKIDTYAQIILIITGLIFGLVTRDVTFITGYFVVGGWQVLSAFIHLFGFKKLPVLKGRKLYLYTLLLLTITGLLSIIFVDFVIIFLLGLLIVSPFLAVWYAAICYGEMKLWAQYLTPEIT
jgi:hypothetical protein